MAKLEIESQTRLPGVSVIRTTRFEDSRGTFTRLFCAMELGAVLGDRRIVQINHSCTRVTGAVRGMHFQRPPLSEMKLIRCIRGRVWDVALDLRANLPTFLEWHAEELRGGDGRMLVIPEGCAHGFQVLEPNTELLYLHTDFYTPAAEGGCLPTDPRIGIAWPLPIADLSDRDRSHPPINESFKGLYI